MLEWTNIEEAKVPGEVTRPHREISMYENLMLELATDTRRLDLDMRLKFALQWKYHGDA